jgi:hypothetical protein
MAKQDEDFITVFTACGLNEANIVKGLLETEGIRCIMISKAALSVHLFTVDGMGEVSIRVKAEDVQAASHLICAAPELSDDSEPS